LEVRLDNLFQIRQNVGGELVSLYKWSMRMEYAGVLIFGAVFLVGAFAVNRMLAGMERNRGSGGES